jgi:GTP cyclohydrolase I
MNSEEKENIIKNIEQNFKELMLNLNLNLEDESLKETPCRVAKMYVNEIFEGLFTTEPKFTVFNNFENYDQIITNSATIFSTCEHHFVPIKMRIHIGYVPGKKCCGISKLIRVAEWFAHRPQVQERLTQQIANYLMEKLEPQGVMVVIEGEHMCEQMRGIKKVDSIMKTSAIKGCFSNKETRDEFMELIRK